MQGLITEWGADLLAVLRAQLESGSPAAVFVVFLAGVLTSFTPCVYPMIPVTVAFIGGAAEGNRRRAVTLSSVYVLGLSLVYSSLGVISALLGAKFGNFTRTYWIYGGVALVFTFFAVMMLDLVTIPVPGFFGRAQAQGTRRGGHLGALLMGVAAGFVAAPCTAPVLGFLLVYVGHKGHPVWGGTLLLVFALGLSFLLFLLGVFSGLLSGLPRAGAWMSYIKKFFGVGMLLVAAWFFYKAIQILLESS